MTPPKDTNDLISRIESKHLDKKPYKPSKKSKPPKEKSKIRRGLEGIVNITLMPVGKAAGWAGRGIGNFVSKHKKAVRNTIGIGLLAATLVGVGGFDFYTKRMHIPERNVLFRARQEMKYSGGEEQQDERHVNVRSITQIYRGGGQQKRAETKVTDIMATAEWYMSDESDMYHLKDEQNRRIANAHFKKERVQAGISLRGSITAQDQFGIVDSKGIDNPEIQMSDENRDAFLAFRFEPERALKETEINILRLGKERQLVNNLTESRYPFLGWLWGLNFRAGTTLEKYTVSNDDKRVQEVFRLIEEFNQQDEMTASKKERVNLLKRIQEAEKEIPRKIVYKDYEDGIFDLNFQESTIYLGYAPGWFERTGFNIVNHLEQIKERLTLGLWDKKVHKEGVVRIENKWDFFPGNIPLLNKIRYIRGDKRHFAPFDKTNNGGYRLIDKKGILAKVEIKDFFLHYGDDLLYLYYLDKNGNGKIDKQKELIGQVLYRVTFEQKERKAKELGKGREKRDVSYIINVSFMGGYEADPVKSYDDFKLCAYLESFMPDQLNRGYGKHSVLGRINEIRSDIMLFNNPTFKNMSRALTEECSLVAGEDIYNVLKAAKRPFAKAFAERTGLQIHEVDEATQQKILEQK
ncbi:hypothetical protein AYK26_05890 [Euryarchaeota archaeon SM23-78]|nr:MAG: hypothetical protein AYK26_05890 [Euryarchaeota archaeon SM23-78]